MYALNLISISKLIGFAMVLLLIVSCMGGGHSGHSNNGANSSNFPTNNLSSCENSYKDLEKTDLGISAKVVAHKKLEINWTQASPAKYDLLLTYGNCQQQPIDFNLTETTYNYKFDLALWTMTNAKVSIKSCSDSEAACRYDEQIISADDYLTNGIEYIKASDNSAYKKFGTSLNISGDGKTIAVVDYSSSDPINNIYIYKSSDSGWQETQKLVSPQVNTIVSSISFDSSGQILSALGASGTKLFIFEENATGQFNSIKDYNLTSGSASVMDISSNGNILAFAQPSLNSVTFAFKPTGFFIENSNKWSDATKNVVISGASSTLGFGHDLSLSANSKMFAVSSYLEAGEGNESNQSNNDKNLSIGEVFIYEMNTSDQWQLNTRLDPENLLGDSFGASLDTNYDGTRLVVGAPQTLTIDPADGNKTGAVYVFDKDAAGSWVQAQTLIPHNASDWLMKFGSRVKINNTGDVIVVSAPHEYQGGVGINSSKEEKEGLLGAVYVFELDDEGLWKQSAFIKPKYQALNDALLEFGASFGLSDNGKTLAVGAPFEDSNASGINGDGTNSSYLLSGAVFVY